MSWLWPQYQHFALGIGLMFWVWVLIQIVRNSYVAPRAAARTACGVAAGVFTLLALLWAAHLGDKYL